MDTRTQELEKQAIEKIFTQLDSIKLVDVNNDTQKARIITLATDLVNETKKLSHQAAINVLMRANRFSAFTLEPAHQIIIKAYRNEKFNRSPIVTGEKTLAFIQAHQLQHAQDVEDFLLDPERVLTWLNQANAVETSRLINFYFSTIEGQRSKYYENTSNLAQLDYRNKILFKNFILLCLLHEDPLPPDTINRCKYAITKMYEDEPKANRRIIQTMAVRVNPTIQTIRNAKNCFINICRLTFNEADFSDLILCGAKLIKSDVSHSNFQKSDLSFSECMLSNLSNTNFHRGKLSHANFRSAIMCDSNLSYADAGFANFDGANLSRVNLFRSNLANATFKDTNLKDVTFFDDKTFDMIGIFKAELNYLELMISQHAYREVLLAAIMNDLLKRIYNKSIPDHLLEPILQVAYEHTIFSQHTDNHLLKSATNVLSASLTTASTVLSSTVFGWFSKPSVERLTPPHQPAIAVARYETRAQIRLREELTNLKLTKITKPAPPSYKP